MHSSNSKREVQLIGKRTVFRLIAISLGPALLLLAEVACRLFGWGLPANTDDPFVGFESVVPLFVPDESGGNMTIAEGRLRFFAADSFPVTKAPGTFRIFCLGGSTVQGRPFSIETSFPTWLSLSLAAADESRSWEVVNCGGVSYASYRLVPILEECLQYDADLILVCTGHNEFLEDRTYGELREAGSIHRALGHSRVYTLARSMLMAPRRRDRPVMTTDVQARLDYQGGLASYHRNDPWRKQVQQHYESNLRRMAQRSRDANVPLMLLMPPSNVADSPPFKTEPNEAVAAEVRQLVQDAQTRYRDNLDDAIKLLEAACELDQRHAANWYELGRAYEAASNFDAARRAFIKARDEDICPLRMTSRLHAAWRRVVNDTGVIGLDLDTYLANKSRNGLLGNELLVDHIHPSFKGNQLIANEIVRAMGKAGFLRPPSGWESVAQQKHAQHLRSLDNLYFLRGQRTLETLNEWARGRERNLPPLPGEESQKPGG